MMWWLLVLAGLLALMVIYGSASRGGNCPPVRTGWLPWLGCAVEFGKEPLNFIKRTKDEVHVTVCCSCNVVSRSQATTFLMWGWTRPQVKAVWLRRTSHNDVKKRPL